MFNNVFLVSFLMFENISRKNTETSASNKIKVYYHNLQGIRDVW